MSPSSNERIFALLYIDACSSSMDADLPSFVLELDDRLDGFFKDCLWTLGKNLDRELSRTKINELN
jgi:hypothetical protein